MNPKDPFIEPSASLSIKEKVYFIILTGLFVSFFLLFFQPFGVNNYDPAERITLQFFSIAMLMGVIVSMLLAFNEFILFRLIIKQQTRKTMIAWIIWSIIWLSTGLFLFYNYLGEWHDFKWTSYLSFIGNIGTLSLIPLVGIVLFIKIRTLRTSLESAHAYTYGGAEGDQLLTFKADNLKDHFTLPLKYVVYLESEDNYVAIYHLKNDVLNKALIRKSLKSIQQEEHHKTLIRCHRSYIINLMHLQQVYGNRNKLSVFLGPVKDPIPVSRQYLNDIYNLIPQ
ncbi:MAG: LytTR family DNA-binding domain-containing protein [Cyclobacteriaceae bacterium]